MSLSLLFANYRGRVSPLSIASEEEQDIKIPSEDNVTIVINKQKGIFVRKPDLEFQR